MESQDNESDCSSDDIPDLESVSSSEVNNDYHHIPLGISTRSMYWIYSFVFTNTQYVEESDDCASPHDRDALFVPKQSCKHN